MKKNIFGMVTLLSVLALAACGGNSGGTDSSGGSNSATETEDISSMPVEVKNDAEAIKRRYIGRRSSYGYTIPRFVPN